ncbi:unnamed protein product [Moneuplotes crassus]|uniref:U-box domain-containing protein n=1 Tax=Euplotes crassus TaxID=5936 RepID=A0AAD1U1I9_EUPCR|nr:unnamed protein product [Moneuplotes crassus]
MSKSIVSKICLKSVKEKICEKKNSAELKKLMILANKSAKNAPSAPKIGSESGPISMIVLEDRDHCEHCCIDKHHRCFLEKYFDKYYDLAEKLEQLLVCPISYEIVRHPAITPSGNLIDSKVLERLIKEKKPDPFNRNLSLDFLITDRFAIEVMKLIY